MPVETIIWIMGVAISVITLLVGAIYKITREEKKQQDEAIKLKADQVRLTDSESRLQKEIDWSRNEHSRLLDKLESRYDKELSQMESRFLQRMDTLEHNLMTRFDLILEMVKKSQKE